MPYSKWIAVVLVLAAGCSRHKPEAPADTAPLKKVRDFLAQGNVNESLKLAKEISNQVPPNPNTEEALYLQGYLLAYYKSDFQSSRVPLKQLLDLNPSGKFAADAQKLIADTQYWQGHYQSAGREYRKLLASFGDKGFQGYAQLQQGNCLLLDDKVGDALTVYRDLVEKSPEDPAASSAQLMIANSYLKLQNAKQAKTELRKLMSFTKDLDIQNTAQKAIRQIEAEEPYRKGVGVPD